MKSGGLRKTTNPHGALPSGRMWMKQFNKALHGGSFLVQWNAKGMRSAWGASIPFCVHPEKSALFDSKRWASGIRQKQSRHASCIHEATALMLKIHQQSNMAVRPSYVVRQDAYKLDQRIRQMEFLSKNNIDTLAQLETYRQAKLGEIVRLTAERKSLYKTNPDSPRIQQVNTALKQLRHDRAEQQQREQERARDRRSNIDLTL